MPELTKDYDYINFRDEPGPRCGDIDPVIGLPCERIAGHTWQHRALDERAAIWKWERE